jgi:hypothetical protein
MGKQTDTALGFILGQDQIVTALQAIAGASRLKVEFAGGRKVETDQILAASRNGDGPLSPQAQAIFRPCNEAIRNSSASASA